MRTIKFRAWDGVNMIYPDWLAIHDSGKYWQVKPNDNYVTLEYPLMQFTGLHDGTKWEDLTEVEREKWTRDGNMPSEWHGKEIYEGDIVRCSVGCPHEIIFGGMNGMPGWWLKGTLIGPMGDYSWTGK